MPGAPKARTRGTSWAGELKGVALAVALSFSAGILVILLASAHPGQSLAAFFFGPFSSGYNLATLLSTMTPLVVTGLALSISFQATVWNLAAEGQVYLGAFVAVLVGLLVRPLPPPAALPLMMVAASAVGALVSLVPAALRVVWGVSELIVSFMTSLLILPVVNYFLSGPMQAPGAGINATEYVGRRFVLPLLTAGGGLNLGLPIALVLVAAVHLFLYRTAKGTSLRLYGYNRQFARYSGIGEAGCVFVALALSGGLCGLAGSLSSLGVFHGRMVEFSTYGMGWNGIAVALVARYRPGGVVPAAFLLAYLLTGANLAGLMSDVPPEVARVVISAIFFLITSQSLSALGVGARRRSGVPQ
jgi:ABC-type uncharacterized transport system permease subunit